MQVYTYANIFIFRITLVYTFFLFLFQIYLHVYYGKYMVLLLLAKIINSSSPVVLLL
jgi:hypothetical protein